MNPITHFLTGWALANVDPSLERRDRALITIAGAAPDADAFGMLPELLTRGTRFEVLWWTDYHHILAHNIGFVLVYAAAAFALGRQRLKAALLSALSIHLHFFGDVIGARGPDGFQWPIPYLLPFSDAWQWSWSGQWALNAWPNIVLTIALLLLTFCLAWKRGHSPLEIFSRRADAAFVATLRRRFPVPLPSGRG